MLATLSHLYAFELHQDGFHREYAIHLTFTKPPVSALCEDSFPTHDQSINP